MLLKKRLALLLLFLIPIYSFADISSNLFQNSFNSNMPQMPTMPAKAAPQVPSNQELAINKTVAIVNDKVITSLELDQEVQKVLATLPPSQTYDPQNQLQIKKEALQNLIAQSILLQIAQRNNIRISDKEIDAAINDILVRNRISLDYLKTSIESSGITFSEYKDKLRDQLMINRLQQQAIAQQISVSPKEVEKYIQKHKELFQKQMTPKRLYLLRNLIIDIPKSKDEKNKKFILLQKLAIAINNKNISFSDMAKQFSEAANADEGGSITQWMTYSEIPPIYRSRVKYLKKGQVSKPFIADNAIQMIYVEAIKEEKPLVNNEITQYNVEGIVINLTATLTASSAENDLKRAKLAIESGDDFKKIAEKYTTDYDHSDGEFGWASVLDNPPILTPAAFNQLKDLKKDELSEPFDTGNKSWMIIKYTDTREYNAQKEIEEQKALEAIYAEKAEQIYKTWITSMKDSAYIKILDKDLKTQELY
ncbi:peptidylprolyl isomerase [Pseudofrancisella aestuarii]|uniref:Peptidylprolyl isomerase n=2 Tax=Bacteria TaxID=2 RepID=A0ABV9TCZ3_9GAMM|nr:peptidylprolyl isomerase [Pseudofrancisella aestuarii]